MNEYLAQLSVSILGTSGGFGGSSHYDDIQTVFNSIKRPDVVKFLDLGCGLGVPLFIAKQTWHGNHDNGDTYFGIDSDPKSARICGKMHSDIRVIEGDFKDHTDKIAEANIVYAYHPFQGFDPNWVVDNMTSGTFIYMNEKGEISIEVIK